MSAPTPGWLAALASRPDVAEHDWFASYVPPEGVSRRSAVLMLFGPDPSGGEDVVLTERAHTLRAHPGQVSFPGGGIDPEDDGSVGAALREAEEEVGLDPSGVHVLATFPEVYLSPSQHAVTPVLGWWPRPVPVGVVDRGEVERVLRVPVAPPIRPLSISSIACGRLRASTTSRSTFRAERCERNCLMRKILLSTRCSLSSVVSGTPDRSVYTRRLAK